MSRRRAAAAGAGAALVWAALEPLDRRLFRLDYSDVAMLGKWVTGTRVWPLVGLSMHAANGATFGLAARELARVSGRSFAESAFALAMIENVALFPFARLVDARHPRRGTRHLAPLFNARGFAQATFRHAVFGVALGRLA